MPFRERALSWAPGLVVVAFTAVWLLAPSSFVHPDALDDLHRLEVGAPQRTAWHPLGESAVYVFTLFAKAVSKSTTLLRAVQVWNGTWLSLALVAIAMLGRQRKAPPLLTLGVTSALAFNYSALHLARDPYLSDWPPALALMCAAALASGGAPVLTLLLLTASACFLPPCLILAPVLIGVGSGRRATLVVPTAVTRNRSAPPSSRVISAISGGGIDTKISA